MFFCLKTVKLADIGYIQIQMLGHHRIVEWADIVIAHRISGPDIVDGIHEAWGECGRRGSVAILAQMFTRQPLHEEYCKVVEILSRTGGRLRFHRE